MIIYNTTFHIEKEILSECTDFLKKVYIPVAAASGVLTQPRMSRVLSGANEEGESICIQFRVKNTGMLNFWLEREGSLLQEKMMSRFKEKAVGFSTLLEEIDWEND